jgi:hypothetical protein
MRLNDTIQSFDNMNAPGSENLAVIRQKLEKNKKFDLYNEKVLDGAAAVSVFKKKIEDDKAEGA